MLSKIFNAGGVAMKRLLPVSHNWFLKYAILIAVFFVQPAVAKSLVICGSHEPGGAVIIDGNSSGSLSLIIKNQRLIEQYIERGFITAGDLNYQGDLVVPMDGRDHGHITNRNFGIYPDGMGGYILTVRYIIEDGQELGPVLANFHFIESCQTFMPL